MVRERRLGRLPGIGLVVLGLWSGFGCAGGAGGCSGLKPLPSAPGPVGLPFNQQIEGGAQVRITRPGFDKLASVVPAVLGPILTSGICIPPTTLYDDQISTQFSICRAVGCGGGAMGCPLSVGLRGDLLPPGGIQVTAQNNGGRATVHIDSAFDLTLPLYLDYSIIFVPGSCTLTPSTRGTRLSADIGLTTDPATGQLKVTLDRLTRGALNLDISGCGALGGFLDLISGLLDTFVGDAIIDLVTPTLNGLIQSVLPRPLGLAASIPLASVLGSLSPPADANLETYLAPGGYITTSGGGLNLGVITGMNSDRDPTTRTAGKTTEASLCVPDYGAPALGGAPWNLPANTAGRPDFVLPAAGAFSGTPEPTNGQGQVQDLAIGLSRTFLDLAGFHFFNSGGMCLAVGGSQLAQLNTAALSLLVPSLGNIADNLRAPLALAIRPTSPLRFTIGAGTPQDPILHLPIRDIRIDFYAFIEQHYVRVFTLAADLDVNFGLSFTRTPDNLPAIQPIISGINRSTVTLRLTNTDLLNEDPAQLALLLGSLIDLAVGQLTGAIPPVALPTLQGFTLDGLSVGRVRTAQDDFVAVQGTIVKQTLAALGLAGLSAQALLPAADWVPRARSVEPVETVAEIVDVTVPPGDVLREALLRGDSAPGSVPAVTLALGGTNAGNGNEALEWSARVDGGGWRAWSSAARQTITDPAFLLQARHTIEVRTRRAGDWLSEDLTPLALSVAIDSVAPRLSPHVMGGRLVFGGSDNVSEASALRYSWRTSAGGGWTPLTRTDALSFAEAWAASAEGQSPVFVAAVDESGNRSEQAVDLTALNEFHGGSTNPPGGCTCAVGADRRLGAGPVMLLALLGVIPLGRRLRRRGGQAGRHGVALLWLVGALGLLGVGGGCGRTRCRIDDDCRQFQCQAGELPVCLPERVCGCGLDTRLGDVGRFANMSMIGDAAYVTAYNATYGDLMIGHVVPPGKVTNWEFVDGVPEDQPADNPRSEVRGGITVPGEDVGRYASLGVTPTGEPVMAYYDQTQGALKFASFGVVRWRGHVVDQGTGLVTAGGDNVGRYASLTMGRDGTPAIAYYAEVARGASGGREGQLRFAQAKRADPQTKDDWAVTVIESRPLPVPPPGTTPPPELLPPGIALFCTTARKNDDSPVIAYYDRVRGNLRYVEYNPAQGRFGTPLLLDGEDAGGGDLGDVGQFVSLVNDGTVSHLAYVDATRDDLLYMNTRDRQREIVDDGYRRTDETAGGGGTVPVYHLVGDFASLKLWQGRPVIAYQDSTSVELRLAMRDPNTRMWILSSVAGHETPFRGAYGFYAQLAIEGSDAIVASYAIDQRPERPLYFVETFRVDLNTSL